MPGKKESRAAHLDQVQEARADRARDLQTTAHPGRSGVAFDEDGRRDAGHGPLTRERATVSVDGPTT